MKTFLRIFATLLVAFGLIAGSLGVAMAGGPPIPDPGDTEIDTDGGDGGNGGDAAVGGGNNDGDIDQDSDQEQNQDADQDQDVDQDNDNNLSQGNNLTANAGGSVNTDCSADQPDGNLDATDDDDDAGGTGDVNSGDDSATCTVGDSSVGDSSTGDSNQANAGSQDASNSNDQDFDQNGGNQANAPSADLDQDAGNEANAGDGGDGGDAENSGSVNVTTRVVTILVRILDSILSGGDTIIVTPDDDENGAIGLPFSCTILGVLPPSSASVSCVVDGATVLGSCTLAPAGPPNLVCTLGTDQFACSIGTVVPPAVFPPVTCTAQL